MTKTSIPDELRELDQVEATPLVEGLYAPKSAWIEGEYLVAYIGPHYSQNVNLTGRAAITMFSEFLELGDAPDDQVKAYAQKWGLLGLCASHDLPYTHAPGCSHEKGCFWKVGRTEFTPEVHTPAYERLAAWRGIARQARAIMNIAKNLSNDEPGDPKDWSTLREAPNITDSSWWEKADSFPVPTPDGKRMTLERTKLQLARGEQSRLAVLSLNHNR